VARVALGIAMHQQPLRTLCLFFGVAASALAQQPGAVKKASPFESRIPDGVVLEADVEYGRAGERSLRLDLFRPRNQGDRRLPVVVYIHGGGWERGDKNEGHRVLAELVLSGNYAAVTVAYRLSGEAIWPAQIHDCKAGVRWVRANAGKYGFDPDRIGACGGSAGGHLAAMLGVTGDVKELEGACGNPGYSSLVQCVAATSGAYDFTHFYEQTVGKSNGDRARMVVRQLLGGTPAEQPDTARSASAVTYVSHDDPPFLLGHGTLDPSVPFDQGLTFLAALKNAGVPATFICFENGGHIGGGPQFHERRHVFFDRYLRGQQVEVSAEPIPFAATSQ
jgi:acetyl esterase/lipase